MDENTKVDEILSASVSIDNQLSKLGKKLSSLTNQPFSKMEAFNCANFISSLREELIKMNTKIIESYISEDKKKEYLENNMRLVANHYRDNRHYTDIIEQKASETILEESLNQDDLPPML